VPRLAVLKTEPEDYLVLPIEGRDGVVRDYTIGPVPAEFWYRVSALGEAVQLALANIQPRTVDLAAVQSIPKDEMYRMVLGDVVDAMLADGIAGAHLQRAFTTALVLHTSGGNVEQAKVAWSGKLGASRATPAKNSKTSPRRS
jgi:hypothetical protein